ncbi:MAG: SIR2 family protein, partial [Gammaproteobacteria bacterium]
MPDPDWSAIITGIHTGDVIPYLGPDALDGAVDPATGAPIPADSDSLILAMNNGNPMAPRLMYEFPRAAMNQELKRGRSFVNRFLTDLYGQREWTRAPLHEWLGQLKPPYVIDINRDTQLQHAYRDTPHTLVVGVARVGGTDYRFRVFGYVGAQYREIDQDV